MRIATAADERIAWRGQPIGAGRTMLSVPRESKNGARLVEPGEEVGVGVGALPPPPEHAESITSAEPESSRRIATDITRPQS
jgi:hypothetical protein